LHNTITELDALGRVVKITDAKQGQTNYAYGPFNALRTVTDPGGAVTRWTRDAYGRVTKLDEPDRGTTLLVHDGFGELLASADALERVTTFGMDALGRTTLRTDKHGAQILTTSWTWDTATNGIGRLHSVVSPDGVKTYAYTKRGQTETMTLGVNGELFTARWHYDNVGRVTSMDYPQPIGAEPFGLTYDHDDHGHRIGVRDKQTNAPYWRLMDVDDAGRYREEAFDNGVKTVRDYFDDKQALESITTTKGAATIQQLGYDWDERLNLKRRTDARQPQNTTERFKYDALNRLTCAYFSLSENANTPCATSYAYGPNGNLTSKSDVGILSYTDPKHPHAVTNAAGDIFAYDAIGNQIARPGGTSVTYTPFDLPKTITQGAKTVSFGYDGDEQKIRKTTPTSETLYFEDMFEQVTKVNSKEYRYYVHSPERVVAVVTRGGNEPGTIYLHTDQLGSVETVTNEQGNQVEKRSYDAFGQRRNPKWGDPSGTFTSKTTKGFTGHEEADEFGLVNMKGRYFDPRLGRFLSTDPIIANVYNGQSFGAYAYVHNNPLTFVDPSGFTEEEAWRLWRVEETGQLGIRVTFDKLTPPSPRPAPDAHATDVGAQAPTNDVDTTGSSGANVAQQPTEPESRTSQFLNGLGDGGGDLVHHLRPMIQDMRNPDLALVSTAFDMIDAYDKGDAIDAVNVVNPLVPVATIGFAIEDEDWYTVGRTSVGVAVTIVAIVVGKKMAPGSGAGTTRGPSKGGTGGRVGGTGALSDVRVGHTFSKHGSGNTAQLLKQAQGSGRAVGQWINDAAAENFIAKHLPELKTGAASFDLPEGVGRMVNPDGTFSPATRARLVPSGSGVKTAYPEP
jgi:RHS repeat-associated protein